MSRRRGEFEHRTSIFESAYRAWSHLGGLDPDDLETKEPHELDPLEHPIENDSREVYEASGGTASANASSEETAENKITPRRLFPYEPLPRSGLTHPYVQAILSPWLGVDADTEAIQLGLTTLRTWWQHRRKGESGSAIHALGTEKMKIVVDQYTSHFFNLAYSLVAVDKEQPPRTLNQKLKARDKLQQQQQGITSGSGKKRSRAEVTGDEVTSGIALDGMTKEGRRMSEKVAEKPKINNIYGTSVSTRLNNASSVTEGSSSTRASCTSTPMTEAAGSAIVRNADYVFPRLSTTSLMMAGTPTAGSNEFRRNSGISINSIHQAAAVVASEENARLNNAAQTAINTVTSEAEDAASSMVDVERLRAQVENKLNSLTKQHPSLAYVQQLLEQQHEASPAMTAPETIAAATSIASSSRGINVSNDNDDIRICLLTMHRQMALDTKIRSLESLLTMFHQRLCRAEGSYAEVRKEIRRMEETEIFFDVSVTGTVREQFANFIARERIRVKSLEDTMERIQYDIDHTERQLRTALQENDLAALPSKDEVNHFSSPKTMMAAIPSLVRAKDSNTSLKTPFANGKTMAPTVAVSPQQDPRIPTMMQDKDTTHQEPATSNGDQHIIAISNLKEAPNGDSVPNKNTNGSANQEDCIRQVAESALLSLAGRKVH